MPNQSKSTDAQTLASIAKAAQEGRVTYFDNPAQDHLLDLILEIAEENCVLKDRLLTAAKIESGDPQKIDAFVPEGDEVAGRLEKHSAYMNALFARIAKLAD